MDMLKGLFGGGNAPQQQQAQDFVNRYTQGPVDQGYTEQEAAQHYQTVAQNADPATIQRAAEQTFTGMDPAQRQQMAQLLQQQAQVLQQQAQVLQQPVQPLPSGSAPSGGVVSGDPREMAGMVAQMHQQNPGGLASLFGMGGGSGGGGLGGMVGSALGGGASGGGGFPGGTLGKVALGGIAAYGLQEVLGGLL